MIEVTGPDKLIEGSFRSYWIAAGNPVPFRFQRKDYEALPSENSSGFLRVVIPGNLTNETPAGSRIYHSEVGRVLTVTNSFYDAGNVQTELDTDALYGPGTTAGYVNLIDRSDYQVTVSVVLDDDLKPPHVSVGTWQQGISTVVLEPFSDGSMTLDLSYLLSRLSNEDVMDYSLDNMIDPERSISFYLIYQESWTGHTASFMSTPDLYYILRASKQIGDRYGQNMAKYTPVSPAVSYENRAQFLTRFQQSRYWPGWPFSLSFIYSNWIGGGETLRAVESQLDSKLQVLFTGQRVLDNTQPKAVHKLTLAGGYDPSARFVDISLETGDVSDPDTYYVSGYFVDAFYI